MTPPSTLSSAGAIAGDAAFMDRALELAAQGAALASPNPMVGAVLVRDGRVVVEGFHTYQGVRHAEIIALDEAGDSARGATMYVTLEPCSHTGRTGPCVRAIITAGVARVVAAMADPNPAVAGSGFKGLRAAGIRVSTGIREEQARRLNEAFARWIVSKKPLVTLKCALTLDGQLVLPGAPRKAGGRAPQQWITSLESRAEVQRMRHESDALMTGIGTVLADDPLLTDRTDLPRRRRLLRVVMDSQLRLPLRSRLVRSAQEDVLVFTRADERSAKARALARAGIQVVRLPRGGARPPLEAAVRELGRREILSVLLEAGGILNQAALEAKVVDKVRVFFAPKIAGFAGGPRRPSQFRALSTLTGLSVARYNDDFAVEGYLRDVYRTR